MSGNVHSFADFPRTPNLSCDLSVAKYVGEIVSGLRMPELMSLADELEDYDRSGSASSLICDILRRAECLASADLLLANRAVAA